MKWKCDFSKVQLVLINSPTLKVVDNLKSEYISFTVMLWYKNYLSLFNLKKKHTFNIEMVCLCILWYYVVDNWIIQFWMISCFSHCSPFRPGKPGLKAWLLLIQLLFLQSWPWISYTERLRLTVGSQSEALVPCHQPIRGQETVSPASLLACTTHTTTSNPWH